MSSRPRRVKFVYAIASMLASMLAGCASDTTTPARIDLCMDPQPPIVGGSIELGLGDGTFTPIEQDDQDVSLVLGVQGLWMLVTNARAHDLDVDTHPASIVMTAQDATSGDEVSIGLGCNERKFAVASDGDDELDAGYYLPFSPDATTGAFEGAHIAVTVTVGDIAGHTVHDTRTVIVHYPP
jgi:hypothetical protein